MLSQRPPKQPLWLQVAAWIGWLAGGGMAITCLLNVLETTKWSEANLHCKALFYAMKGSVGLLAGTFSLLAFLFLSGSDKIQFGSPRSEQQFAKVCYGIFAFISTYMIAALLFDAIRG